MKHKRSPILVRILFIVLAGLLLVTLASCNQEGVGSFSPTGDRVTIVREAKYLYTARNDGSDQQQITDKVNVAMSTSFSPFGDKIAYMDTDGKIWVVNATGGGAVQVGAQPPSSIGGLLSFVPSGHLVWVEQTSGVYKVHKIQPGSPPSIVDLMPGTVDELFVSQAAFKVKRGTSGTQFVIKPYGGTGAQGKLVFVVTQGNSAYRFTASQTDILGPEALARTLTPALKNSLFATREKTDISSAAISPDGTKLVVRSKAGSAYNLWALDLTTNDPWVQLANNANFLPVFAFSPDGSEVVFESNREGGRAVFLASSNGTNIRKLADGAFTPGWFGLTP